MTIYQLEIRAENSLEAKNKIIEMAKNNEIDERYLKKIDEPIDWQNQAKENAKDIFEEQKEEFDKIIKEQIKRGEKDHNEIYDVIYQEFDLTNLSCESADGTFIYNDTDSIKEALDCINELDEYEETDNGLWEGMERVEEQINARATYTLSNAIYHYLEEEIKDYIAEKLIDSNIKK